MIWHTIVALLFAPQRRIALLNVKGVNSNMTASFATTGLVNISEKEKMRLNGRTEMKNNAKYINADALLHNLPDDLPYKASVKRVLMQAPTADVVPSAEVDRLRSILDAYALQYGTVKDQQAVIDRVKAEAVARVLVEIESLAISKIDADLSVVQLDDTYYIQAIDELKEKYSAAPPASLVSLDDISEAIKRYCCTLIDEGKDNVEITEFNADLQKILKSYIGEKDQWHE